MPTPHVEVAKRIVDGLLAGIPTVSEAAARAAIATVREGTSRGLTDSELLELVETFIEVAGLMQGIEEAIRRAAGITTADNDQQAIRRGANWYICDIRAPHAAHTHADGSPYCPGRPGRH